MTTPDEGQLAPDVVKAVKEIRAAFPKTVISVRPDDGGGAFVLIESVPLAAIHRQSATWIGFRIGGQYPHGDIYPHYVRGDLSRMSGAPFQAAEGAHSGQCFEGRSAIMLSRKSHRWHPARDTALIKLQKVLQWLNECR